MERSQLEGQSRGLCKIRWGFILLFLMMTILSNYFHSGFIAEMIPILLVLSLFIAVFLHGKERYGLKNICIFFAITWAVSHFFEAFSVQFGFPFGHYYYDKLAGPRLFEVPLIIMFAYFGTGYASWILSHILLGQYQEKLSGKQLFLIPLVASFIMVMWDLCMDPIASTIDSLWVWKNGGVYFGVPLQNYFGWFLVVYIIFQSFTLYIAKRDSYNLHQLTIFSTKIFWIEAITVYAIQALAQLLDPLTQSDHLNIYDSMALVTIFTMVFVTLMSAIAIQNKKG